jgi:hypothetical protein
MARVKLIRKEGRCYIELPTEFMNEDEIELFSLKSGYYLLSVPLGERKKSSGPSEKEATVLQKLTKIRFENRTPDHINKVLTDPEKLLLKEMGKKGWVKIYKSKKYKGGVYNIANEIYPMLQEKKEEKQNTKQETENTAAGDPNYSLLLSQGFLIIRDQREARALSEKLKTEMKSGSVKGIKGFDNAFYVVTKDFYVNASKSILETLSEEADVQTIVEKTKLDTEAVSTLLHHMAESGDIIEKKKGVYLAV